MEKHLKPLKDWLREQGWLRDTMSDEELLEALYDFGGLEAAKRFYAKREMRARED